MNHQACINYQASSYEAMHRILHDRRAGGENGYDIYKPFFPSLISKQAPVSHICENAYEIHIFCKNRCRTLTTMITIRLARPDHFISSRYAANSLENVENATTKVPLETTLNSMDRKQGGTWERTKDLAPILMYWKLSKCNTHYSQRF